MKESNPDIIIQAERLYKRFCRDMKWSMWYGLQDLFRKERIPDPELLKLRKHEFWAVRDVQLTIRRGQAIGLIGRNGSGKTTLMRLISGIIPASFGTLEQKGRITPIFRLRSGMHPHYTGRDYIYIQAAMHGMNKKEIDEKADEVIRFAELEDFIDAPIGTYSSGMKARLGYSIAIASDFDLLIIDEALAVGDTEFRAKCLANLKEISQQKAIVFVSHNMEMVREVSNAIVVMDKGKKILESSDVDAGIDYYYRHLAEAGEKKTKPRTRIFIDKAAPLPPVAQNLPRQALTHQLELISLHIPKTAGTSFRKILEKQYGHALTRLDIRNGKLLVDEKLFWGSALPAQSKVIHGHFMYPALRQYLAEGKEKPKMITWLRDPIDRVISNYYYLAGRMAEELNEEEKGLNILMKMQKSLLEYAESDFARNRMSKFLEGTEPEDFFFIGLTEEFESDVKKLAGLLGWKIQELPHLNKSRDYRQGIGSEILERIAALNEKDMLLYEKVIALRKESKH